MKLGVSEAYIHILTHIEKDGAYLYFPTRFLTCLSQSTGTSQMSVSVFLVQLVEIHYITMCLGLYYMSLNVKISMQCAYVLPRAVISSPSLTAMTPVGSDTPSSIQTGHGTHR